MKAAILPFRVKHGPLTHADTIAENMRKRFADQFQRRAPDDLVNALVHAVMRAKGQPVPEAEESCPRLAAFVEAIAQRAKELRQK